MGVQTKLSLRSFRKDLFRKYIRVADINCGWRSRRRRRRTVILFFFFSYRKRCHVVVWVSRVAAMRVVDAIKIYRYEKQGIEKQKKEASSGY